MAELVYSDAALADLDAIYDYIAADSPERAHRFVSGILDRCETLGTHPELGPRRERIRPGLRILPLPSRIVVAYRIEGDDVVIMRVFYGGQDFETLLGEG